MTPDPSADQFLRAAVKTALRQQQKAEACPGDGVPRAGVQTLRRIKASLAKRKPHSKTNP